MRTAVDDDDRSRLPAVRAELGDAHRARRHRALGETQPLLVLRQVVDLELRETGAEMALDGVDRQDELVGDLPVRGGFAKLAPLAKGRQSARSTTRWALDRSSGPGRTWAISVVDRERRSGLRYRSAVPPKRSVSPSSRRRRSVIRSPLTYEPFRESPPSTTAQLDPMRWSSACTRETWWSQGQRDVAVLAAADRQLEATLVEHDEALGTSAIAHDEERGRRRAPLPCAP